MTHNLFRPTSSDIKSLKSGREKLRKYGFTADHVPYLTAYNSGDSIMQPTDPTTGTLTSNPALRPLVKKAKKPVAKTTKTAAPKKVAVKPKAPTKATTKSTDDGKISLKAICQELKLDAKAARVKLRRNKDKLGFHSTTDRWSFTEIQAAKVREVLSK